MLKRLCLLAALLLPATPAHARTICTVVADAQTRDVLLADGDCETRYTPASTFKLTLAVMAFDAGIIASPHDPVLPFREGYPDWVAAWRQDTDPAMWMKNSVLWYSQRLAEQLGAEQLTAYAQSFGYGNADFSGDPGFDNGLERAWVSSSLQVSPLEQAGFLAALVEGQLPVSQAAMNGAMGLVERAGDADGWSLWGKTGSAYPRNADRSFDYASGWGWYVGWAEKGDRRLVFARLVQEEQRVEGSIGARVRDALLADWPQLMAETGQ
jgi:beta-lactamase class D